MIIESPNIVKRPEVSVVVLTYNQECYISQCIDAILSQRVDFDYEIIISDDCSQDNTIQICKNYQEIYPQKVKLLLQEQNRGVARNFGDAIALARGTYVCSMGGDDFWILETKLQLQKQYLDTHPKCGLCYTNINICNANGEISHQRFLDTKNRPNSFEEHLLTKGFIAPLTWMYRRNMVDLYDIEGAFTDESFGFALEIFANSEIDYIDIVSANYREISGTLSRPNSVQKWYKQYLGVFRTQQYYCDKYKVNDTFRHKVFFKGYIELLYYAIICEDLTFKQEAISYFNELDCDMTFYMRICEEKQQVEYKLYKIRQSYAYCLGKLLLKPFSWLRNVLKCNKK